MACYYTDSNQPPKKNNWAFYAILILLLFWALVFHISCSPYSKIAPNKRPPETTKDSVNLSGRCLATFPPQDKPEYDIGDLDTTNKGELEYYKSQFLYLSSQKQIHKDSIIKIHDTVSNDDLIGDYDEGYDYGFKVGTANGLSQCKPSTQRVDTFKTRSSADNALIFNLTNNLKDSTLKLVVVTTQLSDTKSDKDRYFWLFIIATVGFVGSSFFAIKKTFFA